MKTNTFFKPGLFASFTIYNVTPVRGGDSFLFVAEDVTFLYDTGYGFASEVLYAKIKAILGERPLDYILLTHSHYDHALGSAYLTLMYPNVRVIASTYAAVILQKESARETMRRLDTAAAASFGVNSFNSYIDYLHADITVDDNDVLTLGSHRAKVIDLPGHTRDSIAFMFEEEGLMLGTETAGVRISDRLVAPSFLVGYRMSLDSIARAKAMKPKAYLVPHCGIIEGEDVISFFDTAAATLVLAHDIIVSAYTAGKSIKDIIGIFEERFYTPELIEIYPHAAFLENTSIQIPMVLKEEGLL